MLRAKCLYLVKGHARDSQSEKLMLASGVFFGPARRSGSGELLRASCPDLAWETAQETPSNSRSAAKRMRIGQSACDHLNPILAMGMVARQRSQRRRVPMKGLATLRGLKVRSSAA